MNSFGKNVLGLMLCAALSGAAFAAQPDRFIQGYEAFQASDFRAALAFWRPLAAAGDARAQYNLGVMYAMRHNYAEAAFWFEKAASQGFDPAKLALKQARLYQARASSADTPVSPSDAQGVCAHCAAQAPSGTSLKSCSRCGIVLYCGRDCQLAHWKAGHKRSCKTRK